MKLTKILGVSVSIALIGASTWFVFNTQNVIDWWRLRDYEPTPEIAQLATDSSMSDEGRRLFYIHDPELLAKDDFQGKCSTSEITIVLGCYISDLKIYVFDVEDERLEGVEEVTAAHEMLHAVYDRLSDEERREIDQVTVSFYETVENERLRRTIESYRERDPSVVANELHSILATEVRDLPDFLEEHYQEYFVDRGTVVTLAEAYESEFVALENQIQDFDDQLAQLNGQIDSLQSSIASQNANLTQQQAQLEALRDNPEAYNAQVPVFNALVRSYNADLAQLRSLIDQYNAIVETRNSIATEEQELVEAIDTRAVEL